MSQRQWIVIIGVWIMVFLFLGFPSSWEKVLAILTGILIIFMAYRIRFKEDSSFKATSFTDSMPSDSNHDGQVGKSDAHGYAINDQEQAKNIPHNIS